MQLEQVTVKKVLTRTSGYLRTITSHSLQPYRGCAFGNALCGAACYVRHNAWVTRGRPWGSFLEARTNAASAYLAEQASERGWAHRQGAPFAIFMSSATEPFMPHERRLGITRSVLEAMCEAPPDVLVVQTHSPAVADHLALLGRLARRCALRVHLSIETDREAIPGLPPHATPVARRLEAARALRDGGIRVVATVSPLLSIADPERFFARLAEAADAVVLDHFIEGDGTPDGRRTLRTPVPAACALLDPRSTSLAYRDAMAAVAQRHLPGRVGLSIDGFAGRFLPA